MQRKTMGRPWRDGTISALRQLAADCCSSEFRAYFANTTELWSAPPWLSTTTERTRRIAAHCAERLRAHNVEARLALGIGQLTSELAAATCPPEATDDWLNAHALLTAWMYIVDDGVQLLTSNEDDNTWLQDAVECLVNAHIGHWHLGLSGPRSGEFSKYSTCLELPCSNHTAAAADADRQERRSQAWRKLNAWGLLLEEVARDVAKLSPNRAAVRIDCAPLTSELRLSLLSKIEEAATAPTTVTDYIVRHERTGHVLVCLELNVLLARWQLQGNGLQEITRPPQRLIEGGLRCAVRAANRAVLLSNELCFAKDIGEAEESLMAVLIASHETSADNGPESARTAAGHGQLLRQGLASRAGYDAAKAILTMLRGQMTTLVDALESFGGLALPKPLSVPGLLLEWVFGYHFLNPTTQRYGVGFNTVWAAAEGEEHAFMRRASEQVAPVSGTLRLRGATTAPDEPVAAAIAAGSDWEPQRQHARRPCVTDD